MTTTQRDAVILFSDCLERQFYIHNLDRIKDNNYKQTDPDLTIRMVESLNYDFILNLILRNSYENK